MENLVGLGPSQAANKKFASIGIRFLLLGFTATLIWVTPLLAQGATVDFDPSRASITFSLGATLHTVHGTFKLKSGRVVFDPATGKAEGAIVVDAMSGDTGNESRDKNMHGEVLESAKFPEIVFIPSAVQGDAKQILSATGRMQAQLIGRMRIHGSEHPLAVTVTVDRSRSEPTVTARFTVPYVDWGLKNPSTAFLRVKSDVDVQVESPLRIAAAR
jgi:polyisoprenoid-binding protein YceI